MEFNHNHCINFAILTSAYNEFKYVLFLCLYMESYGNENCFLWIIFGFSFLKYLLFIP